MPPCGSVRTCLPSDVDTAQLYDGFSVLTIVWLEALGFCGRGESGGFIEGGHRPSLVIRGPAVEHCRWTAFRAAAYMDSA